jgi:hypothetical protein
VTELGQDLAIALAALERVDDLADVPRFEA